MSLSQWAFAAAYDVLNATVEWRIARYRRATAGIVTGDVLEVGGGSGANLRFFPADASLTFLEPNPHMVRKLRRRAAKLDRQIAVVQDVGEAMPFEDGSFDTVLTTLVLCTVRDLDAVVSEARRVLRPGGRFIFYEHVAATGRTGRAFQRGLNPAWKWATTGCHLDRDIESAVRSAGFSEVTVSHFNIRFGTPIALPNVVGVATV